MPAARQGSPVRLDFAPQRGDLDGSPEGFPFRNRPRFTGVTPASVMDLHFVALSISLLMKFAPVLLILQRCARNATLLRLRAVAGQALPRAILLHPGICADDGSGT